MNKQRKILVTAALPYANGPIHLGHLAGAYLPADIYVRYQRLTGNNIIFICGSDEHGVAIMLRARREEILPQKVVDVFHERIKNSFKAFGINFDYYGRTSSKTHHKTSKDFFRSLAQKNKFILKTEKQLFDPEANIFLADRFVRGTCPKCEYEDAYGDQCENCGTSLSPTDLLNPKSVVTNATPILKETTHWYLPLAFFQKKLETWISSHPNWKTNVLGQIRSWFNDGLKDRAVTRDLTWGVAVPPDSVDGEDVSGKVLYVWFDAPIGYISATKEWAEMNGNPDRWKDYWLDKNTELVHFIGKDNIVFHCLIFPAMLMAHGDYVLPVNVPANEFLNLEGNKLSTSRNYAVWLDEYLQKFPPDNLRYVLASIAPETKDSDFSWKDFQARSNFELADILGNFIHRTITFVEKYFGLKVPNFGNFDQLDQQTCKMMLDTPQKIGMSLEKFEIRQAIRTMMDLARFANKYFNDQEPWDTRKKDPQKCSTTLYLCLELVKTLAVTMCPFLPFTAQRVWKLLNLDGNVEDQIWNRVGHLTLQPGHSLGKPVVLFPKIEDEFIDIEIKKLEKAAKDAGIEPKKRLEEKKESVEEKVMETISFEEFKKLNLKVAKVLAAEPVEKTDKLMKIQIDLGTEQRQIIAGIAKSYKPEDLVGKRIAVVTNLEPAVIRGVESNGMLLAASQGDEISILTLDREVEPGSGIK